MSKRTTGLLFFFLSEVLIRDEVKQCSVFMDDQAKQ